VLALIVVARFPLFQNMASYYSNVTLTSHEGDLAVVVYLPRGVKKNDDERTFYYGSRFDHGSMIGPIYRKERKYFSDGTEKSTTHVLFGTDMWRMPHNSHWPESGVGLAAEFGVGDNGAFCFYRCGWNQVSDVTNGVLGYTEARVGEPFLKIGVGALIKGTCPACDSTGDYKFNSPYLFHELPLWTLEQEGTSVVKMQHQASLNQYGYKIAKEITLVDDTLTVTSTLTNLGVTPFSTAWYSHNFFSCDGNAVGPGYSVELNLKGDRDPLYEEPGTWSWSTPLVEYAKVNRRTNSVRIDMEKALNPGVRIKSEFTNDGTTNGGFTIEACGTTIETSIPQLEQHTADISMYAYNLYIERATFSPEPQILMHLNPGESRTWSQRLVIKGTADSYAQSLVMPAPTAGLRTVAAVQDIRSRLVAAEGFLGFSCFAIAGFFLAVIVVQTSWTRYRRRQYQQV